MHGFKLSCLSFIKLGFFLGELTETGCDKVMGGRERERERINTQNELLSFPADNGEILACPLSLLHVDVARSKYGNLGSIEMVLQKL